ncbi:MAG: hypothetical protein ABIK07_21375, partial [Planctomycetota bacterium]
MNRTLYIHSWFLIPGTIILLIGVLPGISSSQVIAEEIRPVLTEKITRHQYSDLQTGKNTPYLLYHPDPKSKAKPA